MVTSGLYLKFKTLVKSIKVVIYSPSGAWPVWAFHIHTPKVKLVKTALKEESSGLQAYMPKLLSSWASKK